MFARQVGIVTGAGTRQGIGRSAVLRFAQLGAHAVYACDLRTDHVAKLQEEVRQAGLKTEIIPYKMDVTSEEETLKLSQRTIKDFGRLDFLCANAGVVDMRNLWHATVEDYMRNFRVMALAPALAIRYGSQAMSVTSADKPEPKGSIVVTGSIGSISGGVSSPPYTAAKHAALGIAKRGAIELAKTRIRVNCIAPGLTSTDLWENSRELGAAPTEDSMPQEPKEGAEQDHDYIHDNSSPEEIANVMAFLASDLSTAINAQVIVADRGIVEQGAMPWANEVTLQGVQRPPPLPLD